MKNNSIALAKTIHKNILKDFEKKKLTGTYVKTMQVYVVDKQTAVIRIPAPKYDMPKFFEEGVIIRTGGSYASELEKQGSTIERHRGVYRALGNHKNVVRTSIKKGVSTFIKRGKKGQIEKWEIKN